MNFADVIIIMFFISALVRGVDLGLARQVCSTVGVVIGLFIGAFIQGKLIRLAQTPTTKALLALGIIIASIALFSTLGELLGIFIKRHIERIRVPLINAFDRGAGSLVAGATLLLAVWLGAIIFSNAPSSELQRQIKGSVVIATLNRNLPPAPNLITRIGHLIDPNSFPNVFTGLEPSIDTSKPLPSIGDLDSAVEKARASTVKIEGQGCGGISHGSGFVADADTVITNAHVIAGVQQPYIIDANGRHAANVVGFDPDLDVAFLRAPRLAGTPLAIRGGLVDKGTSAAIVGYPGGGDFRANPAIVVDAFRAIGRNIYNQGETTREVYSVKGSVRPGNSGGPLIDKNGAVVGVIFAESTSYDDVGYALTTDAVVSQLELAKSRSSVVSTGSCTQ
ncbi:MAG TPA: MarP family serine protease [Candidatus Saccharimonadales bacterium]